MKPIKLGKKHFPNGVVRVSKSWIGNGQWMAKKEFFSNVHLFDMEEEVIEELFPFMESYKRVDDTTIDAMLPANFSKIKRFTRTDWAHLSGGEFDQVLFTGPGNEGLFLDKLYVMDMFDLNFVYFSGGKTAATVNAGEREKVSIITGRIMGTSKLPPSCLPVEGGKEVSD